MLLFIVYINKLNKKAIIELCKMKNIPIYVVNNDISYQD